MGRRRALRTYGHHRSRCISTDAGDIFRSTDESRQIFNTSSSESGLGPSDSVNSAEASLSIFCDRPAKNKALFKLKASEEEKTKRENNKRKKEPSRKADRLFCSDKDSSDCVTPAPKRVACRALHDMTNELPKQQTRRRQPAKRIQPKRQAAAKSQCKLAEPVKEPCINFSEFDDYSLIISDSPPRNEKTKGKVAQNNVQLGTSTPCESSDKTRRTRPSPDIQTADISFIPAIFESSDLLEDEDKSFSGCHFATSPACVVESNISVLSGPCLAQTDCEEDLETDDDASQKNLQRLEESFASLRVGERRLRTCKNVLKPETCSSEQPKEPRVSNNHVSPEEDQVVTECRVRLHKLISLQQDIQKSVQLYSGSDVSHATTFDCSRSLFDCSGNAEENQQAPQTSGKREEGEQELSDVSVVEAEGDLSAIVEDGEEEDVEEECEKSLGVLPDLTHSFAEVLTPAKARTEGGEELSPLEKVLEQCGQDKPLPFTSVIPARILRKCVKIGEGVYGEVFRATHNGESVALKIIPIEGDFEVNDEPQKTFQEILPEIVISNELSKLRDGEENCTSNFCPVKSVSLVQGRYPPELLKQWDIFHQKKTSENDRPDIFGDDQLYIMLEFGDGGCDLESCKLTSSSQAVSVLQQVACALAVAEQELMFEHRDLHVGNVLVQPTKEDVVTCAIASQQPCIDTQGINVSIIDFTLSRLTKDGCTVFCDLAADETLFEGKGDYQFDIYRMMKAENKNDWEKYHPSTNVMWLHYLCDKLIHHKHFQETGRSHRETLKRLRQAHSSLLDYSSASHFVLEDSLFLT